MSSVPPPRVHLRALPGATVVALPPDAIIGRSPAATLRIEDPRVSTVHLEISWRAPVAAPDARGAPWMIARGGRLLVGGVPRREVRAEAGLVCTLVPGVDLEVVEVTGACAGLVATPGPEGLGWARETDGVAITRGAGGVSRIGGNAGRCLAHLLHATGPLRWDALAAVVWPEDAALREGATWTEVDERRYRNRFDQLLRTLRLELAAVGAADRVALAHAHLRFVPRSHDTVALGSDVGSPERTQR